MKRILRQVFFTTLFLGASVSLAQDTVLDETYTVGENLVYEGKYKMLGLAFSVADLTFSVSKAKDGKNIHVKSLATSRGTLVKLISFTFLQRIESTVDPEKLQVEKTVKRDEQKKRIRDSEANFDYEEKHVTYVETDPNDPSRPPRRVASTIDVGTQDVVTAVYMLRRMPLAVGKKFVIKISDSGLVYDVPVNVVARERQKTVFGKIWCWKVVPEIFGEGRFIEQKGSLTIWIADDAKRIPVRAKLATKFGSVHIKLKKAGSLQDSENKSK